MRRWLSLLTAFWLTLAAGAAAAADVLPLPALTARVTDLTASLDANQRQQLETRLAEIERAHGAQIAILLLPSTQPENIEQFGIRLAEAWKIGHQGRDDGVIVIVAKNDRRMRIEVGYGLEGAIPDAVAKRIVAERMAPAFKQGDFAGGLAAAVTALSEAIAAEHGGTAKVDASSTTEADDPDRFHWLLFFLGFASVLRVVFGLLGSIAAAALGGWLGFMIFGSVAIAIGAALLAFALSFVNLLGGRGGGWSSGGGGFSSGGGGFSGGGGSFGGGGASGSW